MMIWLGRKGTNHGLWMVPRWDNKYTLEDDDSQKIHFQEVAKLKTALTGSDKSRLEDLSMMTGDSQF